MPKNKKKFIPKDKALVFHLVHRSQQDPLSVDENAPQHVLKECIKNKKKEEEHKYGIFFDDEYDYLQHLKTVSEPLTDWEQVKYKTDVKKKPEKSWKEKVLLPSSVFQSEIEEPVGVLNKAAPIYGPRPELDPDIVAAMDDDFDYDNPDNILEENFIELANQSDREYSGEEYDVELEDSLADLRSESSPVETRSRFTDYSMTSSVIRRNKHLMLLDDHFEKVFQTYDTNEIGSLDHEGIEGNVSIQNEFDSERLLRLADEVNCNKDEKTDDAQIVKFRTLQAAENLEFFEETDFFPVNLDNAEKWDCETIISTYSNLYNHPAKICEPKDSRIKINQKTGMPKDILRESKLTARALAALNEAGTEATGDGTKSIVSHISELSIRPRNETPEERKIRKHNVKELRRERRLEKKANFLAFKDEKSRQEKVLLNMKKNQHKIKMF